MRAFENKSLKISTFRCEIDHVAIQRAPVKWETRQGDGRGWDKISFWKGSKNYMLKDCIEISRWDVCDNILFCTLGHV